MKTVTVVTLLVVLVLLVRRQVLQVDLSFPWFVALAVLGVASIDARIIEALAGFFGIVYGPLAVILAALLLIAGIATVLTIGLSRIRIKHMKLIRRVAALELAAQER